MAVESTRRFTGSLKGFVFNRNGDQDTNPHQKIFSYRGIEYVSGKTGFHGGPVGNVDLI